MAETIGQHGIAAFTNPSNGDALDANIVKGNDNSLRSVYVDHDSDPGIHVQSSLLSARPAAGTAGRKWLTTDSGSVRLWFDDGSAWQEISYVSSAGTPTLSALNVTGDLTVDTTTLKVDSTNNRVGVGTATPGATLDVTGTIRASNTLTITSGGADVTGTVTATTFSGSGASLTSLPAANLTGTLPAISGANLTNLNASNLASGTVAAARLPTTFSSAITFSAGSGAVVVSNQGFINFSAGAGTAGSMPAFNFNSDYNVSGANAAPALGSAPIAGSGYRWLRVNYNGIGAAYIPMLV